MTATPLLELFDCHTAERTDRSVNRVEGGQMVTGAAHYTADVALPGLPGSTPNVDNTLQPGELVLGIELPPSDFADHSW